MSSESDPNSQFGRVLKEIGGFGPWQRRMAALLWVPSVYAGMWFMIYPFILATPKEYRYGCLSHKKHKCRIKSKIRKKGAWFPAANLDPVAILSPMLLGSIGRFQKQRVTLMFNSQWKNNKRFFPYYTDGSYERCLRHPRTDLNAATCDPGTIEIT